MLIFVASCTSKASKGLKPEDQDCGVRVKKSPCQIPIVGNLEPLSNPEGLQRVPSSPGLALPLRARQVHHVHFTNSNMILTVDSCTVDTGLSVPCASGLAPKCHDYV